MAASLKQVTGIPDAASRDASRRPSSAGRPSLQATRTGRVRASAVEHDADGSAEGQRHEPQRAAGRLVREAIGRKARQCASGARATRWAKRSKRSGEWADASASSAAFQTGAMLGCARQSARATGVIGDAPRPRASRRTPITSSRISEAPDSRSGRQQSYSTGSERDQGRHASGPKSSNQIETERRP